jgi:AraC-like DNA-binding protein/mannose-6-phosphate isomerase-like protein (cupin superfamily)
MAKYFKLDQFTNSQDDQFHIARTIITSSNDLQLHYHDYAEIFWIKEGRGVHLINGERISLQKSSFAIIRPEDKHTFLLNKSTDSLIITNIAFRKSHLEAFRKRYPSEAKIFFPENSKLPFMGKLNETLLAELTPLTDKMMNEKRDVLCLDYFLLNIFHCLLGNNVNSSEIPHWLSFALNNYQSPKYFKQGVHGFAKLCEKSIDHINRVLKNLMMQTLTEAVNNAKLKYAASQLIMTNSPIKKIASDCGFTTIGYFYRAFKKKFGLTPLKYRNRNKKIF